MKASTGIIYIYIYTYLRVYTYLQQFRGYTGLHGAIWS